MLCSVAKVYGPLLRYGEGCLAVKSVATLLNSVAMEYLLVTRLL